MKPLVSHDRSLETEEEKSLRFQLLPLEERMALLVEFTEMALQNGPSPPRPPDEQSTACVRVLRLPRRRTVHPSGDPLRERLQALDGDQVGLGFRRDLDSGEVQSRGVPPSSTLPRMIKARRRP